MKITIKSGCCRSMLVLIFTVNLAITDALEWTNQNCFKDEPPQTLRVNEGEPFKLAPHVDCLYSHLYWIKQFRNGTVRTINDSRITLDPEGTLWFSNATKLDATSDEFYYSCVAVSPCNKNEDKIGNRVILDVVSNNAITSYNKREPVRQYVTTNIVVAPRGKNFELFCIYGGTPLPQTIWDKNLERIRPNERLIERNYGRSLLIKNLNSDDEGVYTCTVSNGGETIRAYSIKLVVQHAPLYLLVPTSADVAEDKSSASTGRIDNIRIANI